MRISIKKKTNYQCEYIIIRDDKISELIELETKTFFEHDICHFVVEKNLGYKKGFWGMLAQGKPIKELSGKNNPMTEELRFIEKIVGPVQSVYWGHLSPENFQDFIAHLEFQFSNELLDKCVEEIKAITGAWRNLPVGDKIELVWV